MIKDESIQAVREAEILKVVHHFIPSLQRSGANYKAKSVFSEDKTASLMVSQTKNIFKCFSSGIGGDAIRFVMEHKKFGFIEAVRTVAEICNITLQEEDLPEEEVRKRSYRQDLYSLMEIAAKRYQLSLHNLSADAWPKKMIADRQINDETLAKFSIGYAPTDKKFVTKPLIEKAKLEMGITVGLVGQSEQYGGYDVYVDRLMFPIHDFSGNIIGFGGRAEDGATNTKGDKVAKYINTKETEIYSKSKVLYGLYQAKAHIQKSGTAILVEGYTDVTGFHQNGLENTVGSGGTALTPEQARLLGRFANHTIICRDNDGEASDGKDQKGTLAALRDINILLSEGHRVSIFMLPEGEDPDSFSRKFDKFEVPAGEEGRTNEIKAEALRNYVLDAAENAIEWKSKRLKNKAANDPNAVSDMVSEVAEMLMCIKDDIIRDQYLKRCAKTIGQKEKALKDRFSIMVKKAEIKADHGKMDVEDAETMGLPDGADYAQFKQAGFVIHDHKIWFKGKERFFPGSNFKITPLFHVYGKADNKRLFEIINDVGKKKIIDVDSSDLINMQKFESRIMDEGNFKFTPYITANDYKLLRNWLLDGFILAYALNQLGWQPEGFFAYADCVFHNGTRKIANDYGIIQIETDVKTDNEYMEDVKHFYSPSASVMHRFSRDGDDPYENDRYLIYKESPVSLTDWMKQLRKVYGPKKSNTGIAFVLASIFRDILMKKKGFFPILFCSGEKGAGKTQYAASLVSLFTYKQEPFDMKTGSHVAFYRRLARVSNIVSAFEEFSDQIDDKKFDALKGSYDGRGRELGIATGDNRTTTTKVKCAIILLGQYLSARDDNSLTSRSIIESFIKPQESYTTDQIENYALLKSWEEQGLSSMLVDILQHRTLVEDNFAETYAKISKKMKAELKNKDYQERMFENYVALLTPISILEKYFRFPFDVDELWTQFKDSILDTSDLIIESEGLAEFWKVLEFLLDTSRIKPGYEFEIDSPDKFNIQTRKGEADEPVKFGGKKKVLFLRLNAVHQLYHKEVSTRDGVDYITEPTLKNYFRSKKYFIGSVKSRRFETTSTSCYAFDYDMMLEQGILNLTRGAEPKPKDQDATLPEDEDLPF